MVLKIQKNIKLKFLCLFLALVNNFFGKGIITEDTEEVPIGKRHGDLKHTEFYIRDHLALFLRSQTTFAASASVGVSP